MAAMNQPKNKPGEVALLHDWLTGFRGGERVFEAMCEMYPGSPIYTLLHAPGSTSENIESHPIRTSFLNSIPGIEKNYRKFLPVFPLAADSMKIDPEVKLVLSSSHCVIKGVKKPKGSVHISYVHSPMRYMYDQYDQYFGPGTPLLQRAGARAVRNYITNWDIESNDNVDVLIANSKFVQERIRKFYGRDSIVVHPFVDLEDFTDIQANPPPREDFYVMVTAFAPNKRVDLAIEAANKLGRELKIIGGGQLEKQLRTLAGPTVHFLGHLSRADVITTLAKARALLFPGVEDFGITPLEALAVGTPVIAFAAGGVLETLSSQDTIFFDKQNMNSLAEAMERFESKPPQPDRQRLDYFTKEQFTSKIMSEIEKIFPSH